jgi:hypothetical protein
VLPPADFESAASTDSAIPAMITDNRVRHSLLVISEKINRFHLLKKTFSVPFNKTWGAIHLPDYL